MHDREAKVRFHMERGYRTVAHYVERAGNILDLAGGGRNLKPYEETHNDLLKKIDKVRKDLLVVQLEAEQGLKSAQVVSVPQLKPRRVQ